MKSEKIILTGASDGIGKSLALFFASQGHSLALVARRLPLLEELQKECEQRGAPRVFIASLDIVDEVALENTLGSLDDALGGCTLFIANAGVTGRSSFYQNAWLDVKQTLMVNVMGTLHGLEFMKLRMLQRKSGTLCGVSSIAGARGMPTAGAYSTSKAALTAHLETMRNDLAPFGIQVLTVAPGFIDTVLTKKNKGSMPFLMNVDEAAKQFGKQILDRKKLIIAPKPYRIIYPILKLLPISIFDWVMRRMYKKIRGK